MFVMTNQKEPKIKLQNWQTAWMNLVECSIEREGKHEKELKDREESKKVYIQ